MKCSVCHGFFISSLEELSPLTMEVYKGEQFVVHNGCAQRLQIKFESLENEREGDKFIAEVLRRVSH